MTRKKLLALFLAFVMLAALLTGCSGKKTADEDPETTVSADVDQDQDEDEENYDTGDASLDDPRNQDDIGDSELLVVSFGTSYNDSRRLTIGAIESAMEEAFPDYSVRRGFTSQIIIDHVKSRDGEVIDNMTEALDRAVANGVKTLVIQPTHLMDGLEYNDIVDEVAQYADAFDAISIGQPLLTSDEDFQTVAQAIVDATASYDDGKTAICFMGHGTTADSNSVYAQMQTVLTDAGYENYFVGTVEATPSVDDVLALVQAGDYERVVLRPLMIVAGDHANNDMAGDDEDSWKSTFEGAGYEVVTVVEGLGQLTAIQDLLVAHAQAAVEALPETASAEDAADAAASTSANTVAAQSSAKPSSSTQTNSSSSLKASSSSKPASSSQTTASSSGASQTTTTTTTTTTSSTPKDGVYSVTVDSSSSMFKIVQCELTVQGGKMTAVMHMSGTGYEKLYMGTMAQAAAASSGFIPYVEQADGTHTFTVPVAALDTPLDCAAFSARKQEWYDRTLTFRSDSLTAYTGQTTQETTASAAPSDSGSAASSTADGKYTVAVQLEGGSGKASVTSPAAVQISGGKITATIIWSSSHYDYMIVNGEKILPITTEGGSTFQIPVSAFDTKLTVIGDTTAMSTPHEVEYTLYFDSTTLTPAG
jgi:sirohydrochlorin cobaltochelatase